MKWYKANEHLPRIDEDEALEGEDKGNSVPVLATYDGETISELAVYNYVMNGWYVKGVGEYRSTSTPLAWAYPEIRETLGNESRSEGQKMWHKVIMTAEESDVAIVLLSESEYVAVRTFLGQVKRQRCRYTWVGGHWCISAPCATKEEASAVRIDPDWQ